MAYEPNFDLVIAVLVLGFSLLALDVVMLSGIKEYEKRTLLFITAGALVTLSFMAEVASNLYASTKFALIGHGFVVLAGILIAASFYLSRKELEREK